MCQNFKSSFGMVFTVFLDMQVFFNYTGSNLEAKYKCAGKYLDVWLCISALMAVCSLKAVFNFLKSEESGQPRVQLCSLLQCSGGLTNVKSSLSSATRPVFSIILTSSAGQTSCFRAFS